MIIAAAVLAPKMQCYVQEGMVDQDYLIMTVHEECYNCTLTVLYMIIVAYNQEFLCVCVCVCVCFVVVI